MPKLSIDEPYRLSGDTTLSPEQSAQNGLYYDESNGFRNSQQYIRELQESRPYKLVRKFHEAFGHPVAGAPQEMGKERREKRFIWMLEELDEFQHADHLVDQVDALIDILYLTYGTLVELGVEPTPYFQHVHEANMRKLDANGKPILKDDGKIAKPEGWRGPEMDIARSLVLESVEQFRENPMFANLDVDGIKDLRRKYENLQSRYGDQLEREAEERRKQENNRRFEERQAQRHNPLINASKQLQYEANRTETLPDANGPRLT